MTLFRVLIVDDDETIGNITCKALQSQVGPWGFYCDHNTSFPDAMERLKNNDYEAVMLDKSISGREGLDGLKEMMAAFPHLAIIIFTGDHSPDSLWQAQLNGAQYYVTKPPNIETLPRVIVSAIARQKAVNVLRSKIGNEKSARSKLDWTIIIGSITAAIASIIVAWIARR